ncbi:MAG: hypothetical protein JNK56_33190, partial [Myxococcales bacterium]|nr:hypothetical protein [Myxococcales bacterium]
TPTASPPPTRIHVPRGGAPIGCAAYTGAGAGPCTTTGGAPWATTGAVVVAGVAPTPGAATCSAHHNGSIVPITAEGITTLRRRRWSDPP